MGSPLPERLLHLLTTSIQTSERLEVLFLLSATRPKTFTARTVATELSMGVATAESALAMLCGRGFLEVSIANDLFYAFAPVDPTMKESVEELVAVYAKERAAVLAVLRRPEDRDPVSAFANAFLVRKKDRDG
jgi:hypothetical protein